MAWLCATAVFLAAQENTRPTFLFPSAQQSTDNGIARRRAAARREGEAALALHDPQLAEQKFLQYCELTPANLPEAGTARRLLAQAQYAYAASLREQGESEMSDRKFRDALQTAEYYLVLPDIHPESADLDALKLLRAQTLVSLERSEDALQALLADDAVLTTGAQTNDLHWQALRLAAQLQLARREWTATLNLLAPYLDAKTPERRDAELLLLRADAELARMDFANAATHYAELIELLPQGTPAPDEMPDMAAVANLHRLRALVGMAEPLEGEARTALLDEAIALRDQLAPMRPDTRDTEWGNAFWCLANEYARGNAQQPDTAVALLQDAFNLLPTDDAHFVDAGMLLAQLQRRQGSPEALKTLQTLREQCPTSPKFGEFSLQLAEYLMNDTRDQAAELFEQLSKHESLTAQQRARAAFGLAECLDQAGQLETAQKFYRMAADDADPRLAVTALLQAAQDARKAAQLDTAIALLVETADRFGTLPANTENELDEARKLRHRAAEARFEAALLLRQRNRPEDLTKAISLVEAFLQTTPDSPRRDEARLEKALMQENAAENQPGQLAEVQQLFKALSDEPTLDERLRTIAFFETARIALNRQELQDAVAALAGFQAAYPQSPYALRACHRRTLLLFQLGQDDQARKLADELLQKWPGTTEAAQLMLLLGDYALAKGTLEDCREALRLYAQVQPQQCPDDALVAQARFERANVLFLMSQHENAEQGKPDVNHPAPNADDQSATKTDATDTLAGEPASPDSPHELRRQALAELASWKDEDAPTLAPQAQMLWGDLLALEGQPQEACEHFQQAHALAGDSTIGLAALGRLGEMLLTEAGDATENNPSKNLQDAINTFDYILKNAQDDELLALAHFRTAQCLRELGKHQDAAHNYQDALRHYKEICVDYEAALAPERSTRYYTLAVFELADLAEQMNDRIIRAQAVQFLQAYAQHKAFPFASEAADRANALNGLR